MSNFVSLTTQNPKSVGFPKREFDFLEIGLYNHRSQSAFYILHRIAVDSDRSRSHSGTECRRPLECASNTAKELRFS